MLSELKSQTRDAVADIRRVVHGLRPPALDDLGLVAAIQQQAARHGTLSGDTPGAPGHTNGPVFSVEAPERRPAAAARRCGGGLLPHRPGGHHQRRLATPGHATVGSLSRPTSREASCAWRSTDDGAGIPEDRRAGVGLTSMRERVEELGGTLAVEAIPDGGTRVLARLPTAKASGDNRVLGSRYHDRSKPRISVS